MTLNEAKNFIAAWHLAADFDALCHAVSLDSGTARDRATVLRRNGITLPRFRNHPGKGSKHLSREDWQELRRYAANCESERAGRKMRAASGAA